jgi:hypothetical protein
MDDNGGDCMSKGKMKISTCPECGFTVKSPWGENDVVDHMMLHAKNHHPEFLKHDKADLKKMVKDA